MIFLSYDYVNKYEEVLTYLIARSISEEYSFDHIEKTIARSSVFSQFEQSDVTAIAFSSAEKIYSELFPRFTNKFTANIYNIYGWIAFAYINIFLKKQVTFETIFAALPLEKMLLYYGPYHEMDISQLLELFDEKVGKSHLDLFMKKSDMSCVELAKQTNIPLPTIKALRYGHRDIAKMELYRTILISSALHIKVESLLDKIPLDLQQIEN